TKPGRIHLQRGEILNLLPSGTGHQSVAASNGRRASRASIVCTLPEVLARVRKGERIWFDDGRIGGVVRRAGAKRVEERLPKPETAVSISLPTKASTFRIADSSCRLWGRENLSILRS